MTDQFTFWAQALDNVSPDHIELRGEMLSPDDAPRRQEAVSLVSGVVKAGQRIFDAQGVQLTEDGHCVVIEVTSAERDREGRAAPIVCHCAYGMPIRDDLVATVVAGIGYFAARIERRIHPEQFELVRQSFEALKKKSKTKHLVHVVGAVVATISLVVLSYWLVSSGLLRR